MSLNSIVIIGAGQAGFQVATSLRQEGFQGRITLIGDEPGVPYQRPPLSKAYLLGKVGAAALRFRPEEFFVEQRIDRIQDSVTRIDRAAKLVHLAAGLPVQYDHLVLATGARNRLLTVPGADLEGVYGVRTLADADALAPRVKSVRHVVVVGAGFIGLEFAAVAAAHGASVHVLETGSRPMARAVSEPMSTLFTTVHEASGVKFDFGTGLAAIHGADGKITGVQTSDGRELPAELLVYGIGVLPNVELALDAGLEISNGICVDSHLLTSDPAISSIGDCASFPNPAGGGAIRLESVQNAGDQAKNVAARLMGKPAHYNALPWFWTDQGELKLQIAGLCTGHDKTVAIGAPEKKQLSVLCFCAGKLVAVESVNRPVDHMAARKLLARNTPLTIEEASAEGFDLKAYEAATRPAAA